MKCEIVLVCSERILRHVFRIRKETKCVESLAFGGNVLEGGQNNFKSFAICMWGSFATASTWNSVYEYEASSYSNHELDKKCTPCVWVQEICKLHPRIHISFHCNSTRAVKAPLTRKFQFSDKILTTHGNFLNVFRACGCREENVFLEFESGFFSFLLVFPLPRLWL